MKTGYVWALSWAMASAALALGCGSTTSDDEGKQDASMDATAPDATGRREAGELDAKREGDARPDARREDGAAPDATGNEDAKSDAPADSSTEAVGSIRFAPYKGALEEVRSGRPIGLS